MAKVTGSSNYTFNNVTEADMAIGMSQEFIPEDIPEGTVTTMDLGTMEFISIYKYAGNDFYGVDKMTIKEDAQGMLAALFEEMIVEITCANNVIYVSAQGMQDIYGVPDFKVKDNGTFEDLQSATGLSMQVSSVPLFAPSAATLSAGRFQISDDGAVLVMILSGEDEEAFIEKNAANMTNMAADVELSEITYKVYLDENGEMTKIEYVFDVEVDAGSISPGMVFKYQYRGTITVTNVGTTAVSAPANASLYQQADFI